MGATTYKPNVLLLSLASDISQPRFHPLITALSARATVSQACDPELATEALTSGISIQTIVLTDVAIASPQYNDLSRMLLSYVQGGALLVFCPLSEQPFNNSDDITRFNLRLHYLGLDWKVDPETPKSRRRLQFNMALSPELLSLFVGQAQPSLQSQYWSPTALLKCGNEEEKIYYDVTDTMGAAVAMAKSGAGCIGWMGQHQFTRKTAEGVPILLAMCGLRGIPAEYDYELEAPPKLSKAEKRLLRSKRAATQPQRQTGQKLTKKARRTLPPAKVAAQGQGQNSEKPLSRKTRRKRNRQFREARRGQQAPAGASDEQQQQLAVREIPANRKHGADAMDWEEPNFDTSVREGMTDSGTESHSEESALTDSNDEW